MWQDAFLHPQLILDQVDALENVVRDSMMLCQEGGDPDKVCTGRFRLFVRSGLIG